MISAVLDTNVLASGITGMTHSRGAPGSILRLWLRGGFDLIVSPPILEELDRTLEKPYFRAWVSDPTLRRMLSALRYRTRYVESIGHVVGAATHPEDDLILATATSAGADYLVTGDLALQQLRAF